VKAVMFNFCGEKEYISFPFTIDIYAWRAICHIAGDGNIHIRKKSKRRKNIFPYLRWTQWPMKGEVTYDEIPPKKQRFMRSLLERLSRLPGGYGKSVNYPKALSYVILGAMPGLTIYDLRTPRFIQFVIDLPPEYREWKIQFLAAFIFDDGSVGSDISFTQKDGQVLEHVISLCDQLELDHSPLYPGKRDGVHNFQLGQEGIQSFTYDLSIIYERDFILGLWDKHTDLETTNNSFSPERKLEQKIALFVSTIILEILGNHKKYSTKELRKHKDLEKYLQNYPEYWLNRRLEFLFRKKLIKEAYQSSGKSFRPKHWYIDKSKNAASLIKKLEEVYNDRSHAQSYKRKNITTEMVEAAIEELIAQGLEPSALNVSRLIGCSKKQLYRRKDLRKYFIGKKD
jgi:hypothetical protein